MSSIDLNASKTVLVLSACRPTNLAALAFNAASAFGGQILPAEMPETVRALVYSGWIPAATYTVCAALILLFTDGSLSYHPEAN